MPPRNNSADPSVASIIKQYDSLGSASGKTESAPAKDSSLSAGPTSAESIIRAYDSAKTPNGPAETSSSSAPSGALPVPTPQEPLAQRVAKGVGRFAWDVAKQQVPPLAGYEAYKNGLNPSAKFVLEKTSPDYSGLTPTQKALMEKVTPDAATVEQSPWERANYAAQFSALQDVGLGTIGKVSDLALEGLSPIVERALTKVGLIRDVPGEIENIFAAGSEADPSALQTLGNKVARRRIIGSVVKGATGGAAANVGLAAITPHASLTRAAAFGALMGGVGGAYSPEVRARIAARFPEIAEMAALEGNADIKAFDSVATALSKRERLSAPNAAGMVARVLTGKATDVERMGVENVLSGNPELLKNPLAARLFNLSRIEEPTEIAVPDAEDVEVTFTNDKGESHTVTVPANDQIRLKRLFANDKLRVTAVTGPNSALDFFHEHMRPSEGVTVPSEGDVNNLLDSFERGDYIDALFAGQRKTIAEQYGPGYNEPRGRMGIPPEPPEPTEPPLHETIPSEHGVPSSGHEPPSPFPDLTEPVSPIMLPNEEAPFVPTVRAGTPTIIGTPVASAGIEYALPPAASPKTDIPPVTALMKPKRLSPADRTALSVPAAADVSSLVRLVQADILKPNAINDRDTALTVARTINDYVTKKLPKTPGRSVNPRVLALFEKGESFLNRARQLSGETVEPSNAFVREAGTGEIVRVTPHTDRTSFLTDSRGRSAIVRNSDLPAQPHVAEIHTDAKNPLNSETLKEVETALDNPSPSFVERLKSEKGAITFRRGKKIERTVLSRLLKTLNGDAFSMPDGSVVTRVAGEEKKFASEFDAFSYFRHFVKNARIAADQDRVIDSGKLLLPAMPSDALSPIPQTAAVRSSFEGSQGKEAPPINSLTAESRWWISRGKAVLQAMGVPGRKLSSLADIFHETREMSDASDLRTLAPVLKRLKQLGATVRNLEYGTAHPETIALYKQFVLPVLDRQFSDAQRLGLAGDPILNKLYVPHLFDIRPNEISDSLRAEAKTAGIANDRDELAQLINNTDTNTNLGAMERPGAGKAATAKSLAAAKWLREKSAAIAGSLEKARKGDPSYIDDVSRAVTHSVMSRNRRIAEAATFGPHLERIDTELAKIVDTSGSGTADVALRIMNDVRGKVHVAPITLPVRLPFVGGKSVPLPVQAIGMDISRLMLNLSGPRHIPQSIMLLARLGLTKTTRGLLNTMTHPIASTSYMRDIAAGLGDVRFELSEGDRAAIEAMSESPAADRAIRIALKGSKALSKIGTLPLHMILGTIRNVAAQTGKYAFDGFYTRALSGNADALAVMQDFLKSKVTPDALRQMDRTTLQNLFAKNTADYTAFTFRPQDMPGFARTPLGKWLLQFRTYLWEWNANIYNELTHTDLSRRRKAAAALLIGIPALGWIDPTIRHKMGADTIDSAEALDALDRLRKDPNTSTAAYYLMQSAINAHALNLLGDVFQGINIGTGMTGGLQRSVSFSVPVARQVDSALSAAHYMALYERTDDPNDRAEANALFARIFGGIGTGVGRSITGRSLHIPKHQALRPGG